MEWTRRWSLARSLVVLCIRPDEMPVHSSVRWMDVLPLARARVHACLDACLPRTPTRPLASPLRSARLKSTGGRAKRLKLRRAAARNQRRSCNLCPVLASYPLSWSCPVLSCPSCPMPRAEEMGKKVTLPPNTLVTELHEV